MRIRALLVACLVAASSLLIATPAQAAPATVYIYKLYYNSPGSDTGSNTSLNAEYLGDPKRRRRLSLRLRVDGAGCRRTRLQVRHPPAGGWQVRHHSQRQGTSYTTSASTHLYWGRSWYVWNNTGDKVILRRADDSLKDTCTYPGEGASKYYC
jgi:hypothetical protein